MFEEIRKRYKNTGSIHHAYLLLFSNPNEGKRITEEGIKSLGISIIGNPDYSQWIGQTFGIDDARALKLAESSTGTTGKRWFLIQAGYFTEEAQNVLLKVFEEPSGNSHFFIIAPREEFFIPTLRSRMAIISSKNKKEKTKSKYANFYKKTPGERLQDVEEILSSPDEEVRGEALMFLNEIEEALGEALKSTRCQGLPLTITTIKYQGRTLIKKFSETHEAIVNARRFISKNQGSKKLLLEYIALTAPVM